jgi:hypothetical protein
LDKELGSGKEGDWGRVWDSKMVSAKEHLWEARLEPLLERLWAF